MTIENESNTFEIFLNTLVQDFGGLEIFDEENESRLNKAVKSLADSFSQEKKWMQIACMENIPQKLYSVIEFPPEAQQRMIDNCLKELSSLGLTSQICENVISGFISALNLKGSTIKPIKKIRKKIDKKMGILDYYAVDFDTTSILGFSMNSYQYKTCIIGDKEWFAENFNNEEGKVSWRPNTIQTIGECCSNKNYGRLYNHDEATENAPEGWRLPTLEDFEDLVAHIKSLEYDTGTALKSTNQWRGKADAGLDLFGFCAYPTTRDSETGEAQAWFWTSSKSGDIDSPYCCVLLSANSNDLNLSFRAGGGYRACVRYVRDITSQQREK